MQCNSADISLWLAAKILRMTQKDHIQLWDECRIIIRDNLPEEQFTAWFKDITSLGFDGIALRLSVPSQFFVELLEEKYGALLVSAIRRVYGQATQLTYSYPVDSGNPKGVMEALSGNQSVEINKQRRAQAANPFQANVQQPFDPQLNSRYTFENYCEGESNKIARAIGLSIAGNPKNLTFNPLFVFGSTGVGKTHLIQAIGIRIKENNPDARVLYVTSRLFESQYTAAVASKNTNDFFHFYQSVDTLIIDDVQDLRSKPGTQNTFFHIFNHLHQLNKQIIMSSDCAPSEMQGFEDRLLSRFKWGMAVELFKPDLALRRSVLNLKARQNGLDIPAEVLDFIAENVSDSIRELEGILVSLVGHATIMGSDISMDLARDVVEHAVKVERKTINFEMIAEEVCSYYQLDPDLLFTKNRRREVSDARQMVMYFAKKLAKMPLVSIGHKLGRTHATVKYGCDIIEERIPLDKQLRTDIDNIEASILG